MLPIIRVLLIALAILLDQQISTKAFAKGDVLVLLDQSSSMRINNPGFLTNQWLFDFVKTLPGSGDVVVAGFDEKVHSPITISRKEVESTTLLQAKLGGVKLAGRVTDFEQPLQYLLNYSGDLALTVIVTDGEPEIWDNDRYWYLSRQVFNDARYHELNDRYKAMFAQGFKPEARYRKLFTLYSAKNLGLIEERLAEIKKKATPKLVFIDVYGKFDFLKRWAEMASARLIVAPSPKEAINALLEPETPVKPKEDALTETVTMENKPMKNKPPDEMPNCVLQAHGQTGEGVQPIKVVSLPPLTVTLENAKELLPGAPSAVYLPEAWGIILALGVAVLIMGLLWLTRELALKQSARARKREIELEQRELQRITEENLRLEQEQGAQKIRIIEVTADLSRLQDEKTAYENKLSELKQSIDTTVEEYRQARIAAVDSEAVKNSEALQGRRLEQEREIEQACASLKGEKLSALEREIEAEKAIQAEVISHRLAAEFKQEEEDYAQKMQGRKEKALEELTNWKIAETARQQQLLADDLAKVEAGSKQKIDQWEQEAATRVQGLLESRYHEQKESYKNDLRLLAEERDTASKTLESLNIDLETQQDELERKMHEIKQELGAQERKMLAAIKEQGDLLWQETVAEAKIAKEEAMARIRRWEREEKERSLSAI